ncbi:MAG: molybdopterin-containing oxidoreductase family protein [Nitrososphaerales archaeon]
MKRREFLKLATASALLGGFGNLEVVRSFEEEPQEKPRYRITKRIPSTCGVCDSECSFFVTVGVDLETGVEKVIKLEGRKEDLQSGGKLCAKGQSQAGSLYDPDRLLFALKRTNPNKGRDEDPGWVVIPVVQALDEIAEKLKNYAPEEVFSINRPKPPFSVRLGRAMGWRRADHRDTCYSTQWLVQTYLLGGRQYTYGFPQSKYLLLFGWDLPSKAKIVYARLFAEAKKNGAKIVSFNPVLTATSKMADEYYKVKPGTDLAIALAMINLIIDGTLYDESFLKNYTTAPLLVNVEDGLFIRNSEGKTYAWCEEHNAPEVASEVHSPALLGEYTVDIDGNTFNVKTAFQLIKENVATYTPDWAAGISGVPSEAIARIAEEFAESGPTAVAPLHKRDPSGPSYANSWLLAFAIHVLNALIGSIDHEGGGPIYNRNISLKGLDAIYPPPTYPSLPEESPDGKHLFPLIEAKERAGYNAPGIFTGLADNLLKGWPHKVKAVIMRKYGLLSFPNPTKLEEALRNTEFVVLFEIYPTETCYYADYVLPESFPLENTGLSPREFNAIYPAISVIQPVSSLGEAKGFGWYCVELGFRLKPEYFTEDKSTDPAKKISSKTFYSEQLKQAGIASNFDNFAQIGYWSKAEPFVNYAKIKSVAPEGRIQIYCEKFKTAGFTPVPIWSTKASEVSSEYPYYLVVSRPPVLKHANPLLVNNPWLKKISEDVKEDHVWIHPEAATRLGIKEDDWIYVESVVGSIKAKAHITASVREDCVLAFHGLGHWSKYLSVAGGWGYNEGDLVPDLDVNELAEVDPSGGAWMQDVVVKIYKG